MKKERSDVYLPEEILMEIMAKLPVRSIVRIKLVCREWRSVAESARFRVLYQSNDWSMLHGSHRMAESCLNEVKLDDLPRDGGLSFASLFTQNMNTNIKELRVEACVDGLVLLRLQSDEDLIKRYYVGNPVLPQWIQLPPPSPPPFPSSVVGYDFSDSGLVTQMHDGALIGYKVVRMHTTHGSWIFDIFSSDTGEWSVKHVSRPRGVYDHGVTTSNPVSLGGKLHWLSARLFNYVVIHDFFSHQNSEIQVISLPPHTRRHDCRIEFCCSYPGGKKILTTSQGYCMLIDVEKVKLKSYTVKVWRLKTESWSWEQAWEIDMASTGLGINCVPMAINYFDIHIIYLWDVDHKCLLACNLRSHTTCYGTRKEGTVRKTLVRRIRGGPLQYKEDTFCFEERSCLTQFVPSLQLVPTLI